MKGLRVLLVTMVGPGGQVDVAVRADVPLWELAAAVAGAVGSVPDGPGLDRTLAEAGAVDGDVILLGQENPIARANH